MRSHLSGLALSRAVACLAVALVLVPIPLAAADGDLDPSFEGGAFTVGWTSGHARASVLEPLPAGELLVGGTVGDSPGTTSGWVVARLDADGARDLVWGLAFQVIAAWDETMAVSDELLAMRRIANERTMLAGSANAGLGNHMPMLARLGPNGGLDDTFDGNGIKVLDDRPVAWEEVETHAAFVLPDGGTLFTGSCVHCPLPDERWVWVAKRLPDGSPDTAFSTDGWHTLRFNDSDNSFGTAIAMDDHGKIVVGGAYSAQFVAEVYLARLVASSAFDGSFGGGDGIAGPFPGNAPNALALDPSSGRIAIASGVDDVIANGQAWVFTSAGALDTTFSGDGKIVLDREEGATIASVAFQSDGRLLAVGTIDADGANTGGFYLVRMTRQGALDATFDGNGVKRVEFDASANGRDGAYAVTTMGGRMIVGGYVGAAAGSDEEFGVVRTESALVFADGFERGSTTAWSGS